MKTTSKKLFVSVFALLFALVAVATTSFAWFTISGKARVDAFNLDITMGEGIEVRIIGHQGRTTSAWKNVITLEDLKAALPQNLFNGSVFDTNLDHMTSSDAKDFYGIKQEENNIYKQSDTTIDSGWLEFRLEFRANKEYQIYLTEESEVSATKVDFSYTLGDEEYIYKKIDPAGAVRVGFVEYTIDTGDLGNSNIWEPVLGRGSYGFENPAREPQDGNEKNYRDPIPETDGAIDFFNSYMNFLFDTNQAYIKAPEGNQNTFSHNTNVLDLDEYSDENLDGKIVTNTSDTPLLTLATGTSVGERSGDFTTVGSLLIRIWIEGWDADCFNAIFNQKFEVSMTFEGKLPEVIETED